MMRKTDKNFGYARHEGFTVVSLPYAGNELQFVVLLPDEINGLRGLESKLSADVLAAARNSKSAMSICICQSSNSSRRPLLWPNNLKRSG